MTYLGNLSQFFWLLAKDLFQLYSLAPYAAGCEPQFSRLNPQLDALFPLLLNIETIHSSSRDDNRSFKCSAFPQVKAICLQIHRLLCSKTICDSSLGRNLLFMCLSFNLGQISGINNLQTAADA